MRWNSSMDGAACFLHFACPQVFQRIAFLLRKAYVRCLHRDGLRLTTGVEQSDDRVSVRFHLGEHLLVAGMENSFSGNRILVDGEDCGVFKVLKVQWVELRKIDAEDEGGRSKGPQAHLSLTFHW